MATTIRDVANLTGVSPSTVSRVLNSKGTISEETKQRILNAMEQLQYVPNDVARNFANGSSRNIALVIDATDAGAYANNFFNNTVFGLETVACKKDYNLIITSAPSNSKGSSVVEKMMLGKKIDGVVLPISLVSKKIIKKVETLNFPCVIIGHPEEISVETNWVDINNVQAAQLAVKHLLHQGYTKLAFLSNGDAKSFNKDRISGFCRELAQQGHDVKPQHIIHGEPTLNSGIENVKALLESEEAPDAVICSDDRLALGALRAAQEKGLKSPQDFGIISFDNTAVTELSQPDITSIDVDTFDLGVQAAEILIRQIENSGCNICQSLFSTKIIERASTQRLLNNKS